MFKRRGAVSATPRIFYLMMFTRRAEFHVRPAPALICGQGSGDGGALVTNLAVVQFPVGANSFAKAVCQTRILFRPALFANEFAPTVNPVSVRAFMQCSSGAVSDTPRTFYLMMLTRRAEFNVRPALFHQGQVNPRWREVGQVTAAVHCQVFHRFDFKLFELLLVRAIDPAG